MTTEEKLKALAANIIPPKAKKSKKQAVDMTIITLPTGFAIDTEKLKAASDDLTDEDINLILDGIEDAIKRTTKGFLG